MIIYELTNVSFSYEKEFNLLKEERMNKGEITPSSVSSRTSRRRLAALTQGNHPSAEHLRLVQECYRNPLGWPALHWALTKLHRPDLALEILCLHPEQAKLLSPEMREEENYEWDGWLGDQILITGVFTTSPASSLLLAVQENDSNSVRMLLELGVDPNFSQSIKTLNLDNKPAQIVTPLSVAIQNGNSEIAAMLLAANAATEHVYITEFFQGINPQRIGYHISREPRKDYSAVALALEHSDKTDLLRLILAKQGNLPLEAISDADLELVKKYSKEEWPPLHRACLEGDVIGAARLIVLGINPEESYGRPNFFDLLPQTDHFYPILDVLKERGYPLPRIVLEKAVAKDDSKLLNYLFAGWEQIPAYLFTEQVLADKPNILEYLIERGYRFNGPELFTHACAKGSLATMKIAVREYGYPEEKRKECIAIVVRINRLDLLDYLLDPSLFSVVDKF